MPRSSFWLISVAGFKTCARVSAKLRIALPGDEANPDLNIVNGHPPFADCASGTTFHWRSATSAPAKFLARLVSSRPVIFTLACPQAAPRGHASPGF